MGAGALDARNGASAAAHFEQGGTNLHFAHNDADCLLCRAQHLGDASPFSVEVLPQQTPVAAPLISGDARIVTLDWNASRQSRAPPATV